MTDAWEWLQNDFDNMTDAEIEFECLVAEDRLHEAEDWLEAVAAWKAAGRPRSADTKETD
jgi:hypothetical protein